MIKVSRLSHRYANDKGDFLALDNLSFSISDQENLAIIGPSGCGKTTLLRLLGGFIAPSVGDIQFNGQSVGSGCFKAKFGYVFQRPSLLPWLTVQKNVELSGVLKQLDVSGDCHKFIEKVGLSDFKEFYPKAISGGMQQRAALARALVIDPEVLLLDEPFSSLDDLTREKMSELLLDVLYDVKKACVFATHNLTDAVFIADRIMVMATRPGKILELIDVPFQHPRKLELKETGEFLALTRRLKTLLSPSQ